MYIPRGGVRSSFLKSHPPGGTCSTRGDFTVRFISPTLSTPKDVLRIFNCRCSPGEVTQGDGEKEVVHSYTHTQSSGPAMYNIYEQQFRRSRGDAAPGGEDKKTGEKSSWGSLTRPRPDPPSEDGATKNMAKVGSQLEGKPPVGGAGRGGGRSRNFGVAPVSSNNIFRFGFFEGWWRISCARTR